MNLEPSFTTYLNRRIENSPTRRGRKRTKVIGTLGPSTDDDEALRGMLSAGMNIARLNMGHGSLEDHQRRLEQVRRLSHELERPVGVMVDLQGPKIRTGKLINDEKVTLVAGQPFIITTDDFSPGDATRVGTTYPGMANDVRPGSTILINDGRLKLEVITIDGPDIHCTVSVGGILSNNKGINLPGVMVSAPSLDDRDLDDLAWALSNDIDYLALSFVRSALDVLHLKRRIEDGGKDIPVIAKIEREEAVRDVNSIIDAADGIMVARGDLGIEISTERLPVVQKELITRANAKGKLVITATQMLESMIEESIPTRAETSDVANAVFDGSDAVMLSGETAVGSYALEAVTEMAAIAGEAEESPYMPTSILDENAFSEDPFSLAMTGSADYLARTLGATAIMVIGPNPLKPLLLSKRRNPRPCITVCTEESQWRRQAMYWGTVPLLVPRQANSQALLDLAIEAAVRARVVGPGSTLVVLLAAEKSRARTIKVVDL